MTLCAAGPLVALADRDEAGHAACAAALPDLSIPLLTTWPAFTEAMDLADATLRAVAEEGGLRRIFTLDAHLRLYRPGGDQHLDVVA